MRSFSVSSRYTALPLAALSLVGAQYVVDSGSATARELEHLYFDAGSAALINAVQPCSTYTDPTTGKTNNNLGRQSAAEWVRCAFHDFVTAQVWGTGGIDASIGFETARAENVGPAFDDSLTRFSYYYSQKVSMSDLIALGVVLATSSCGGPHVPLRGGRIDATAAGPSGVPQPETNIHDTLTDFGNANFNQDDSIALTACGHTLGGVHHSSFPQVVPASAVSSTNTDGRQVFDETPATFDTTVINDYLKGTGDRGGPLVTTSNVTVQSDLRLYSSDNNATINRLAQSTSYFQGQCADLFQRMIETVPSGTSFTRYVDPTTTTNVQPYGVYLSLDWSGNMVMTGYFRYVQLSGAAAPPSSLTVTLINRAGKSTTTSVKATSSSQDTGNGLWGPTRAYPFTLKFPASVGVSGLSVNGQTFAFQDTMFVAAGLSSVSPTPPAFSTDGTAMGASAAYKANVTVAYLPSGAAPATLTGTFAVPVPQSGTVSPKIDTSTTSTLKKIGTSGPYTIYSSVTGKTITAKQAYGTSVDVAVTGSSTPGVMFFKPFLANE